MLILSEFMINTFHQNCDKLHFLILI